MYFEALSVFRGRGEMQVRRGRVREGSEFVHQFRAPFCSPKQKSLCLSEYSSDKKQVRSGLTEEKETHIFFFSPEFLFPSVAKGTSLASE